MSIVPLDRVTFIGVSAHKERLLDDLHALGCLELIPLRGDVVDALADDAASPAREALEFLLASPQRRPQVSHDHRFDAGEFERRTLDLQRRLQALEAERDELLQQLEAAAPWGEFEVPADDALGGLRLWFYAVPHRDMPKFEARGLAWQVVNRDPRQCYVVVVDRTEPTSLPVPRVHVGAKSLSALAGRLEEVEAEIGEAQAERSYLTRWCLLFAHNMARLEDAAARSLAAQQTCDRGPLFALEAWAPREQRTRLAAYAAQHNLLFDCRPPGRGDQPPTLLRNPPRLAAGEDLVNFYRTPNYWTWDPSSVVLLSFALFFAMILADAGYAALLGVGLLLGWRRLGATPRGRRYRPLLALVVAASLAYGVLVGSYFGVAPSPDSPLGWVRVVDLSDSRLMMGLSVFVGGLHVVLANVLDARRHDDWRDGLASLGWACAVTGGLLYAGGALLPGVGLLAPVGGGLFVAGLTLVVGFTAPHEPPLPRLLYGLLGLSRITTAFGDVLSYLRLFALGLASASLATAFNQMAVDIRAAMPRLGLPLSLLVLLFGHALNLLLGVTSGVIHGMRLNVIEFFNWGLKDEGRRFIPFRRKEVSL